MQYILARLKEPSTHAGIALLIMAITAVVPQYSQYITGIAAVFGFGAAALPESK